MAFADEESRENVNVVRLCYEAVGQSEAETIEMEPYLQLQWQLQQQRLQQQQMHQQQMHQQNLIDRAWTNSVAWYHAENAEDRSALVVVGSVDGSALAGDAGGAYESVSRVDVDDGTDCNRAVFGCVRVVAVAVAVGHCPGVAVVLIFETAASESVDAGSGAGPDLYHLLA